ncbi:hypothetical protein [Pedobacter zeae]|uniref:Uncharacterized protein n=1 Tax=Pedobacter zeae TaxID=1737356 RepID=A0A7W6P737_9SPHI|nr:hypothetical protein [Pedobacter zeae]MBB4108534.1 hypothetical protein [Pedobacter zeae]
MKKPGNLDFIPYYGTKRSEIGRTLQLEDGLNYQDDKLLLQSLRMMVIFLNSYLAGSPD